MTTLVEAKQELSDKIKGNQSWIQQLRVQAVDSVELAEELRDASGIGLTDPYVEHCTFYGEQRALLRGLLTSDIIKFNLPTPASIEVDSDYTIPAINGDTSATIGYRFFDMSGTLSIIDDPALYYLTKRKTLDTTDRLSTIADDIDGYLAPIAIPGINQKFSNASGLETNYTFSLIATPVKGTVDIYVDNVLAGSDNGSGIISGGLLASGTVDYVTKEVVLVFNTEPETRAPLEARFDGYRDEDAFDVDWEQVDFTISSSSFGPGGSLTLKKVEIGVGVLDLTPKLLDTVILRRKDNHQQYGQLQVICEGLVLNDSWDHLLDDPEDMTELSHSDFADLAGFIDITKTDDVSISANPYISSSSKKVGSSYPDIELNPFWPSTDGTYQGEPPFPGNFVHIEDAVPKWSIHNDIKWVYGTAPASLGDTDQEDPATVTAAMTAASGFSSVEENPIPDDTGSSSSEGETYTLESGFVIEYVWTETEPLSGIFAPDSGSEFFCYFNDVANLRFDHLNHLKTQLEAVATLGNFTNTITPAQVTSDTAFFNELSQLITLINNVITYHNAFTPTTPITGRPTYDTTDMDALVAGSTLDVAARLTEITGIIGADHTEEYAKEIYDACNMATHRAIGYIRGAFKKFNSLLDIYEDTLKKQTDYALYP